MHLTVRLFAGLRERAGADELRLEDVPEGASVAELKEWIAARHPELGALDHVRGVVGDAYVPDDTPVRAGDRVALLPPVSGGSSDADLERGVFEVRSDPLDAAEAQARVSHPTCGAALVFTGSTRGHNRGQDVSRLDYEAFEEMAGAEMARIFGECLQRFGPGTAGEVDRTLRMLCLHRSGTVGVGEPSVVVAVASPHRDAAFLACRFLIDELKARVPLWKKEVYSDGHHWIGDRS